MSAFSLNSLLIATGLRTEPMPLAFPPPYHGMLAVNSDVEFTSWETQVGLIELTGKLGLESGFSYWCFGDMEKTWCLFDDADRPSQYARAAFHLARSGLLDTLHSFGGATDGKGTVINRKRMKRALAQLADAGIQTRVYSNHGCELDIQNVGGDWAVYQEGDVPGSPAYHTDLTIDHGMRFFWTDIDYDNDNTVFAIAQDDKRPPLFAAQNCRDGSRILRFRRHRGHLPHAPHAGTFADQIQTVLSRPIEGYSVLYQHFGVLRNGDGEVMQNRSPYFDAAGMEAWEKLAELQKNGSVLVTTTERLLTHALLMASRPWRVMDRKGGMHVRFSDHIDFEGIRVPLWESDLAGWMIAVETDQHLQAEFKGKPLPVQEITVDGKRYAGFPWQPLPVLDILDKARSLEP